MSLRLPESEVSRLESTARAMGVDRSTLLRWAVRRGASVRQLAWRDWKWSNREPEANRHISRSVAARRRNLFARRARDVGPVAGGVSAAADYAAPRPTGFQGASPASLRKKWVPHRIPPRTRGS